MRRLVVRKTGRRDRGRAHALLRVVLPESECLVIACGACDADTLRELARPETAKRELDRVRAHLDSFCTRVRVSTPYPELDAYVNGWAVYQSYVGRMLARASLYQSGGAFGFRDQLQDALNLLCVDPALARARILDACAHQYAEGDVMHWWHRGAPDKGVRTRISDDLVWLPWAVCEYLDATRDETLLAERVAGIDSEPLRSDEESRYEDARTGAEKSVLEHAAAALRCVLRRGFGAHGLLLMGAGDWCDGFDAVGRAGRGESVWLTEFFAHTARRFALLLESRGDTPSAAVLQSAARRCIKGVEDAWDGAWYRRGYFDSGAPLGSRESRGCKIDSVAQSWAAFASCGEERVRTALKSALSALYDRDSGLSRLFAPPFGPDTEYAGYVNGYGPGFRENGGQYTHAAVWLASACLRSGLRENGLELLGALLRRGGNYGAEPFVLAADVYSAPGRAGEAGWSWYTGSAGWFFRTALFDLAGARFDSGRLVLPAEGPVRTAAAKNHKDFTGRGTISVANRARFCYMLRCETTGRTAQESEAGKMRYSRDEILPGVYLSAVTTDKFGRCVMGAALLSQLEHETACLDAMIPRVLRRGTARLGGEGVAAALEALGGASAEPLSLCIGEIRASGFLLSFRPRRPVGRRPRRRCWASCCSRRRRAAACCCPRMSTPSASCWPPGYAQRRRTPGPTRSAGS